MRYNSSTSLSMKYEQQQCLTNSRDADSHVECRRPVTPRVVDSDVFSPRVTLVR